MNKLELKAALLAVDDFYTALESEPYELHIDKRIVFKSMLNCFINGDTAGIQNDIDLCATWLANSVSICFDDVVDKLGL